MDFNFYEVDYNYIEYLKEIDDKVPDIKYGENDKFFCGVVTEVNGFKYFAPISSFTRKQKTNLMIYNSNQETIASIRFCFMIPVDAKYLKIKSIEQVSTDHYKKLLSTELSFCRKNKTRIQKAANRVYAYGTNPDHQQYNNCCDFKKLEEMAKKYNPSI
ncbi:type III toxin-antitoxin system ToxN/AbiQ family toxin [Sporosarcina aquimarina]|uniref:Type III toxin-antitoxin system ToxN/AbiQ family toxin n=1 Tax=Sporosarcina aquimarina TaxID=114975 RepID=A0ABU4G584_9BACL|nr:type III toxin-antitoxin system ToxN/AbiQ family toxin [Sporosarcina aquimarina]MDW0111520.1 type III toxin-antitoxin system ToxN/AbiQ family toxin [Sporosarcina aquimarina]